MLTLVTWVTLGEESRPYDRRPSSALSFYTGIGHNGARGSGTRLICSMCHFKNFRQAPPLTCEQHVSSHSEHEDAWLERLVASAEPSTYGIAKLYIN